MAEPVRFVRFRELKDRFGITWSRMHIDRQEKLGRFPARCHIARNTVAWVEAEIVAWQEAQMAARKGPPVSPPLAGNGKDPAKPLTRH